MILFLSWTVAGIGYFFYKLYGLVSFYTQSGFQLSIESNFAIVLVLHCCTLWLAKKYRTTFATNQKLNRYQSWRARTSFPTLGAGLVPATFASSSDWFIGLSASVVIYRQSNYFSFGFTTLNWKTLYQLNCFVAGVFLNTTRTFIRWLMVTWHLTNKLFPAKPS